MAIDPLQLPTAPPINSLADWSPLERLIDSWKAQRQKTAEEEDAARQIAKLFEQSQQQGAEPAATPTAGAPAPPPQRSAPVPQPLPPQVPRGLSRPLDPRAQENPIGQPLTPNQRVAGGFNEFNPLTPQQRITAGHEAVTLDPAQRVAGGFEALPRVIVDTPQKQGFAPDAAQPAAADPMARAQGAISTIESGSPGGNYQELGPITRTGDRAYGKYQVMGANVPDWTEKYFGQRLTPSQFVANPAAQDAVFNGKFGEYTQKYGPTNAAKAWFAGERGMTNPNARDQLGTSVSAYADKFNRNMGLPPEITSGASRPEGLPKAQAMAFDTAVTNLAQPQAAASISAGGINKEQIAALYRNPLTRPIATAYLQKAISPERYDFHIDGENVVRYNKANGAVDVMPLRGTKPQIVPEGGTLVDATGKVLYGGEANQWGKLPANHRWVDPNDKSKGTVPIPGGPGETVAAEVAGRIGLAKNFLKNMPDIERRIEAGEVGIDNPRNHLLAIGGQGAPGDLRRKIDSGADALIRMMTGAGMNIGEATDYARRYRVTPFDTKANMQSKVKGLAEELRSTATEVAKGHGGFQDPSVGAPTSAGVPSGKPVVGQVYHGRPYLGGDPANPKSWGPKQ